VSVSESLSDRYGVHLGDVIALDSPTGVVRLPVVGVVPDYVSDRGSVILNRRLLVERWGDRTINRVHVFLEPTATVDVVRERIKAALGDRYRLKILSLGELLDYHTDLIDRAFAVMNSVQLLIIIVTIAGIFDLLLARILERRHELALWRVVGADDVAVRQSVIIESATIGAIGAVLGVGVGMVTAWIWIGVHFRQLLGYYVEYHFALGATAWYVVLVVVTTMVAGYAAAAQATRQSVLQGIQTE
jgi:putative ABC transport system permease protein